MISERDLQKIDAHCPAEKKCRLLSEYRELSSRYINLRKIKLNLIRAFDAEVTRLKTIMKEAGLSMDDQPKGKRPNGKEEGEVCSED